MRGEKREEEISYLQSTNTIRQGTDCTYMTIDLHSPMGNPRLCRNAKTAAAGGGNNVSGTMFPMDVWVTAVDLRGEAADMACCSLIWFCLSADAFMPAG